MKRPGTPARCIRFLFLAAGAFPLTQVNAQTLITSVDYQYLGTNFAGTTIAADPSAAYSCLANLQVGNAAGPASGTPPRTLDFADDFLTDPAFAGQQIQAIRFIMWNAGGSRGARLTQGSLQLGFWMADGSNGLPGTYLNESGHLIGYTTPLHEFDLGATVMTIHLGDAGFTLGSARLWAAIAWEGLASPPQNQGGAGSLGYVVASAPTIGQTNPLGARLSEFGLPFGQSSPPFDFISGPSQMAMEFIVPSPAAATVFVVGGIAFVHRRRR